MTRPTPASTPIAMPTARSRPKPSSIARRSRPPSSALSARSPTECSPAEGAGRLLGADLFSQTLFLGLQLGRELGAEVLGLEHRADLDLRFGGHGVGAALDPLDGFVHRLDLPQPEAGHQLLGFGEGPVDDGAVLASKA